MKIDPDLIKSLEDKISKRTSGTFYLGRKPNTQEIGFDGSSFFSKNKPTLRWFPSLLASHSKLSSLQLDNLLSNWYSGAKSLKVLLAETDSFAEEKNTTNKVHADEMIENFLLASECHLFQSGKNDVKNSSVQISTQRFQEMLAERSNLCQRNHEILPSSSELLVLSPSGVSARDHNKSWLFSKIAMLVDGFRTIEEITTDSPFSPTTTLNQLATAAKDGLVFKTTFPELDGIDIKKVKETDHDQIVQQLETAIKMAADPIMILDKLLQLFKCSGDTELAHSTEMRMVEAYRCARNPEAAITRLEKIIATQPHRNDAKTALIGTLVDHGEELLRASQPEEGRRYLRKAINCSDDDQLRIRLITSYENLALQFREGIRVASRLYRDSKQDRAISLIENLDEIYPDNEQFQRVKIDFFLDHGEIEIAEDNLKRFAAKLAADGNLQEARNVVGSIEKLRRKKDPQGKRWTRGQKALRRIRQFVLVLPFLIFCGLIIKTEFALQNVIANAESMTPENWKKQATPWLRWLPPGPWRIGLEDAAALVEERIIDQKRTYSTAAQEALSRARQARILGNAIECDRELNKASKFGAAEEAKLLAKKWQQEDKQANELRRLVDLSRQRGDFPETRRLSLELIRKHPANGATVGVTIPIKITSAPGTYIVADTGETRALPCWIEITPFRSKNIVLKKGNKRSEFSISAEDSENMALPAP